MSFIVGVTALTLLYLVSPANDVVYMIYGGFGKQYWLFVLYYFIGILGVYFLSIAFSRGHYAEFAKTISLGSIVILAFQGYLIERIAPRLESLTFWKNMLYECYSLIASVVIMLLFIPFIRLCQRYFPLALGKLA